MGISSSPDYADGKLPHATGRAQTEGTFNVLEVRNKTDIITGCFLIPLEATAVVRGQQPSYWKDYLAESYFILHVVTTFMNRLLK